MEEHLVGAPNIACKVKRSFTRELGGWCWRMKPGCRRRNREVIMLYTRGQRVMVAFKPSDETFGVVKTPYFFIAIIE